MTMDLQRQGLANFVSIVKKSNVCLILSIVLFVAVGKASGVIIKFTGDNVNITTALGRKITVFPFTINGHYFTHLDINTQNPELISAISQSQGQGITFNLSNIQPNLIVHCPVDISARILRCFNMGVLAAIQPDAGKNLPQYLMPSCYQFASFIIVGTTDLQKEGITTFFTNIHSESELNPLR